MKIYYTGFIWLIWIVSLMLVSCAELPNSLLHHDIDLNRFSQLLSKHLLFDHFDKAYLQLSKKISLQFRNAIHVKMKTVKSKTDRSSGNCSSSDSISSSDSTNKTSPTITILSVTIQPPVDLQILKRQLKGAVGSFIEDKLPTILANRHNSKAIQNYIEYLLHQYCPTFDHQQTTSCRCILDNQEAILQEIRRFTTDELQSTLLKINQFDLPKLFEKTRAQIVGILVHFNQHMMDQSHQRLELKIKDTKLTTSDDKHLNQVPVTLPTSYTNGQTRNWITPDMIQEFFTAINHTDHEAGYTIQHFIDLST